MSSSFAISKTSTLLIVDDDAGTRESLRRVFESAGYRAIGVIDGPAALRLLHTEDCDLLILDVEMPGISGLALCRLLRAREATKQMPILILSASDDESRKAEAFAAGADDYIVKPSTPLELLSRVASHLQSAQREWALLGSNHELQFLADLGRGLLKDLDPNHVVRRVAGATYEGTAAAICAAALSTAERGQAVCVFDREGSAEGPSLLLLDRLNKWLISPSRAASALISDHNEFFLRDEEHRAEYIAPLRFGGRTHGALIAGFDLLSGCGDTERRLIDAAAQQAALAAHVVSLYQGAQANSVHLALEVEHRTAEAEAQRRFTEAIIDTLPVSLYAIDRDFRVVAWNRNRELGGQGIARSEALGRNIFDVLTRQPRDLLEREFKRAFESGEMEQIVHETPTAGGDTQHWLVSKIPMRARDGDEASHVITVGEDITARVEAGRAVARAEKLAAVGRLAAGVVHEINNPLATISACAEALESRVADGTFDVSPDVEDLRAYLALIRSEAFRCKAITNGLLDFSRTRAGQHVPIAVSEVLRSVARLVAHQQRGDNIEIAINALDDIALVSGDEGQLQQALIALATNAIDAMPKGGRLTLQARNENANVLIDVSDTGIGISSENLTKIFDPFFTTKEVGHGTGLGLAVCYGIVTEHGGRLDVQSSVGVGTTFTISLPAVLSQDGDETA